MRILQRISIACLALACSTLVPGCAIFSRGGASDADSASSRARRNSDVELASYDEPTPDDKPGGAIGLSDFAPSKVGATVKQLSGRGPDQRIARQLYGEAEELYRLAQQAEATGQEDLADRFLTAADRYRGAADRWPDSALEEDALFRAGECFFQADNYVKANDAFEELLKKYPNSRYLDPIGARRFVIAKYWVDLSGADGSSKLSINLLDEQRPWTDTFGHAIRIYDRMRLDDPTGKLADDATIAAANALFVRGDYERADEYYNDLRLHFPSSEHQFMAHYLGIQAKVRSYRGPEFAGEVLEEAEKLIKNVRRQFPAESREHEEELTRAYRKVRYYLAEREWEMAQYYAQRHQFGAARFYVDVLLNDYSDTPFADLARGMAMQTEGKPPTPPQRLSWLVDLFPDGKGDEPKIMATAPSDTISR